MGFTRPDRIPLFPLNVVLLPGAELPLHIFEPRYREMVNRCMRQRSEFGMLLSMPNGVTRVGCTAEIMEILTRYPDGRMDIITVGRVPFRAVELFTQNPLMEGQVDYLEDKEVWTGAPKAELVDLYETCHTLIFDDYPKNVAEDGSRPFSFLVASSLPMDLLWKQQVLELRTESERQERLISYLRGWAPHLQKVGAVRAKSVGNGHGLN
jgi:ATP-dependent Lon protease